MTFIQTCLSQRPSSAAGRGAPPCRRMSYIGIAAVALIMAPAAQAAAVAVPDTTPDSAGPATPIAMLIGEALRHNAEIAAARAESDAARQRVAPAAALDDPMLEAGLINAPLPISLRREDMTMKMLGLSQRLPFPGKRALRRGVALADADSVSLAVDETANRVVRDVRLSYENLRLALTSKRLASGTLAALSQLVSIAQARYEVGQATQSDSLQAQIQVVKMQQELLRLEQEETMRRSELRQFLGRAGDNGTPVLPTPAALTDAPANAAMMAETSQDTRPQLKSLAALVVKSERELDLARRDFFPDFELRLNYGQRDRTPSGMPRDDMVSLTVAVNLPLWRTSRLEPRVAEAVALRRQATSMADSQRLETRAAIERELATERQQRRSASLFHGTLAPQAAAAFDTALAAYRVGRVDFLTLLEARMQVYDTALGEAEAIALHNSAVAQLDFLAGHWPDTVPQEIAQP